MSDASAATKRWIAVGGLSVALLLVVVFGLGASGEGADGDYKVRAIFDTASFLVPGEDVKIAGVKVGAIDSLDVTKDNKAAVVLNITDPAFQDFKRDAECTIRLQSLIGEKYVSCQPTQPRPSNEEAPPSLRRIGAGDHEGQYLLPVEQTSSPVDIDLLNNIMRMPQRQRFAIIINELGVGLAGNGEELRKVVRRANPALKEFDKVLAILASQNRVLADLARDSDAALASVANEAGSITEFIDKAGETATATAERGDDLEDNFERFPEFLAELTPTMRALGQFADAGNPVVADLRAVAPSVSRIFEQLGPFSEAALPTFRSLGELAETGQRALVNSQSLIDDASALGSKTKPLARSLAKGLTSLEKQHGIERLLDVILFTQGTANGFDDVGHYLRSFLVVTGCLEYQTRDDFFSCGATLERRPSVAAGASPSAVQPSADAAVSDAESSTPAAGSEPTSAATGGAQAGLLGYLLGNGEGQ